MQKQQYQNNAHIPINIDYNSLKMIAFGGSAVVYGIYERIILEEYYDEDDDAMAVECSAFERLSSHTAQYLGKYNKRSIILERGVPHLTVNGPLATTPVSLSRKIRWIRDVAEGLRYIHQMGIIHADFGCPNIVLMDDCAKIIEFGGCSVDGSEALCAYSWYSRRGKE